MLSLKTIARVVIVSVTVFIWFAFTDGIVGRYAQTYHDNYDGYKARSHGESEAK